MTSVYDLLTTSHSCITYLGAAGIPAGGSPTPAASSLWSVLVWPFQPPPEVLWDVSQMPDAPWSGRPEEGPNQTAFPLVSRPPETDASLAPESLIVCSSLPTGPLLLPGISLHFYFPLLNMAFQVVLVVKNPPANAGDVRDAGSIPGCRRTPGGGPGNPLQYSCLENPTDRRDWWTTVYRVTERQTRLRRLSMHALLLQTQSRSASNWRSRFREAAQLESSCQYLLHWSSFLNRGPQKKSLPGEILRRSQERSAGGVHPASGNWTVGGLPQKKSHVYVITEPAVGLLPQWRHWSSGPRHYKAWEQLSCPY